jgi:MATE family multidrug resistance protein
VQFNLYVIFPIAASAVGRTLGAEDLGAFSLGALVGSLTCLSVIVGALSAADTLMPRAYGSAHYEEIGRLAIRSVVVCGAFLLPLIVFFTN